MQNAGLGEAQAGIKIARRNISNLRYADDTTLMERLWLWQGTAAKGRRQRGCLGEETMGRNIPNTPEHSRRLRPLQEREEELKSLLMKVKEESEKAGLKLNIKKTKIMASGPITSWHIDGETVETLTDFIFLAPKSLQMVTAAMKLKDTCSLEEKLWQTWTAYQKAEILLCQQRSV